MIALDFTPAEEARIVTVAHRSGLAPADYVKRLVQEHLPPSQSGAPAVDAENAAAIAQLQSWLREEATEDPEELRQAQAESQELMQGLNRNRLEGGERPLHP